MNKKIHRVKKHNNPVNLTNAWIFIDREWNIFTVDKLWENTVKKITRLYLIKISKHISIFMTGFIVLEVIIFYILNK